MNVPKEVVVGIISALALHRVDLELAAVSRRSRLPTMRSLRWRVDVTLSSNVLARVMEPSVLLRLELSDGSVRTLELSVEAFDKLRHSVASVLKRMRRVESHPIMAVVGADIERDRAKSEARRGARKE